MKKAPKKHIFFAYESGHPENVDAIKAAVTEFNQHQHQFKAKTWEELEVGGKVIDKTILKEIDKSEIFACDLTYLNHNVLFELGYAIGKEKKLLVFVNKNITGATERYNTFKILKNIGYVPFENHKAILTELQKKKNVQTILLSQLVNLYELQQRDHDIFYIASKIETQASLELTDYLKTCNLKIISDNTTEIEYQTLIWYIKSLLSANSIIIHLLSTELSESYKLNSESSFYAGLGLGLGRKVLLIAQKPFRAPIDYSDILIEFDGAIDSLIKVEEWINNHVIPSKVIVKPKPVPSVEEKKLNLIKLGIGYEVAEDEKDDLLQYFIEIDAYRKALDKSISIFVGQKGSGKSALFIKLSHELEGDAINYNVILKPDSDELLDNVELSKLYDNERSRKSFFYSVWCFVIYSRLLSIIASNIKNNPAPPSDMSTEERNIIEFEEKNKHYIKLNFFGVIGEINKAIGGKSLVEDPNILNEFHKQFLSIAKQLVHNYFSSKKYFIVNILADNLDKTWDSKHDLSLQSEMILSLFESSNKLLNEIKSAKVDDAKINTIIFLRKDIFEYVLSVAREPDKLTVRSYEINWLNYPNLLKRLVEERFRFILDLSQPSDIEKVWTEYFDISKSVGEHPFDVVKKIIAFRPRDIIYFFTKLFESAVNNGNIKVSKKDLEYAIGVYGYFLQTNLIAEMKAEFPKIDQLFNTLFREHYDQKLEFQKFKEIVFSLEYNEDDFEKLLNALFSKKYIACKVKGESVIINNLDDLKKKLKERKFFLFKKKLYIIPNPQEYLLKKWKNI